MKIANVAGARVMRRVCGLAALVALGCADTKPAAQGAPLPRAVVPQPVVPQPSEQVGQVSAAFFDGDVLDHCMTATVRYSAPQRQAHQQDISAEQAALLLFDDAIVADRGGDAISSELIGEIALALLSGDREFLKRALKKVPDDEKLDVRKTKEKPESWAALFGEIRKTTWPVSGVADLVEKGVAVKAQSCFFPDRKPLGYCLIEGTVGDAAPYSLNWAIDHPYYGVKQTSDTDAGMKRCLRSGGRWEAPEKNDRDAARERLRQRLRTVSEGL